MPLALAVATIFVSAQAPVPNGPIAAEGEWNPLKANKDIEVGTFYLKKGNYDAAIDRFEEATRLQPGFAAPYLKLGETYEKMKNLPKAVDAYKSYLQVYKTAPDAKDVRKKIDDLEKKMARQKVTTEQPQKASE
jgi:tetratricopeptide (TPR) repeat protein